MRRQGPYQGNAVPSFATLVADSTPARQALLQPLVAAVTPACANYDAAAPDVHDLVAINLTKPQREALIDGYDSRTVAIKRRLGKMLESLPLADADLCPYCSLDTNPDLDHFLPKAVFPEFSLHARNLVPICTPCNRKKLNAIKAKGIDARLFLHPSSEPSQNARVLEADLTILGRNLTVAYRIDDAGFLCHDERALVLRHYRRLGLGARYARRARSHLASFKASVKGRSQAAIGKALQSKIADSEVGEPVNSWRPALYRAVAARELEVLAWLVAP
jgi:hypothetical protein